MLDEHGGGVQQVWAFPHQPADPGRRRFPVMLDPWSGQPLLLPPPGDPLVLKPHETAVLAFKR